MHEETQTNYKKCCGWIEQYDEFKKHRSLTSVLDLSTVFQFKQKSLSRRHTYEEMVKLYKTKFQGLLEGRHLKVTSNINNKIYPHTNSPAYTEMK